MLINVSVFAGSRSMSKTAVEDNVKDAAATASSWETLVLFVVKFTKLNVQMNMGNVMGNVR